MMMPVRPLQFGVSSPYRRHALPAGNSNVQFQGGSRRVRFAEAAFDPKVYMSQLNEAAESIRERWKHKTIDTVVILGSGLGHWLKDYPLEDRVEIPYEEIPHFKKPTIQGHAGTMVLGIIPRTKQKVAFLSGRYHLYEGHSAQAAVFPLRVLGYGLGAKTLIVSNAAGYVNKKYSPGTLMFIRDHINNMGRSCLEGPNLDQLGPRFPGMSLAYDEELLELAQRVASAANIQTQKGVYLANLGPQYETPAEVIAARRAGADAVGMSTVHETTAAVHMGMRVLGISCLTNPGAGVIKGHQLGHDEVMETGRRTASNFKMIIDGILRELAKPAKK